MARAAWEVLGRCSKDVAEALERVAARCFPRMQALHFGGEEERLIAVSMIAPMLQCPR